MKKKPRKPVESAERIQLRKQADVNRACALESFLQSLEKARIELKYGLPRSHTESWAKSCDLGLLRLVLSEQRDGEERWLALELGRLSLISASYPFVEHAVRLSYPVLVEPKKQDKRYEWRLERNNSERARALLEEVAPEYEPMCSLIGDTTSRREHFPPNTDHTDPASALFWSVSEHLLKRFTSSPRPRPADNVAYVSL